MEDGVLPTTYLIGFVYIKFEVVRLVAFIGDRVQVGMDSLGSARVVVDVALCLVFQLIPFGLC